MSMNEVNVINSLNIATIDHMTHIENLKSIMQYGLLSHNNQYKKTDISNQDVNRRRNKLEPINSKNLHDYVPFYFNPRNAMMYPNKNKDIVILGFDRRLILKDRTIFTNKNAATDSVKYFKNVSELMLINWDLVWSESWYDKLNSEEIKQTMMAEVLVYNVVPIAYLKAIYCKTLVMKQYIEANFDTTNIQLFVKSEMFFN